MDEDPPGIGRAEWAAFRSEFRIGFFTMIDDEYLTRVCVEPVPVDVDVHHHKCPACGGRALARKRSDGSGQLHCFARCTDTQMLAAVGLTQRTLYSQDGRIRPDDDPYWWREIPRRRGQRPMLEQ